MLSKLISVHSFLSSSYKNILTATRIYRRILSEQTYSYVIPEDCISNISFLKTVRTPGPMV